jgi:Dyp-type peroxidase family
VTALPESAASSAGLDLGDIQGMALRPYRFPFGVHLLMRITDETATRLWLGSIGGRITTVSAVDAQPQHAINIGLSWQGLKALGMPESSLQSFPEAFGQGMAARAARLGDVGDSAPERWDAPFGSRDVHILVTVSAVTEESRATEEQRLLSGLASPGSPAVIYRQAVALLPDADGRRVPVEHFGYRDGIGQPSIEGSGIEAVPGQGTAGGGGVWHRLKAGEFVLGYPDETGELPASPSPGILGRNGTYLVLRKLHQHVRRFRDWVGAAAGDGGPELLMARIMGRWRSGAPLALTPEHDDLTIAADGTRNNNFSYAEDLRGLACPVGAHIRRMNPRAGLPGTSGAPVNRHRVLRQGLPYGNRLDEGKDDDGAERGAVIVLINADIARQFEFVQKVWINDGDFAGLSAEKDPLIGSNDGTGSFTVPRRGAPRQRLTGLPAFVSTRGGEYFFLPGLRALNYLASAESAAPPGPERSS